MYGLCKSHDDNGRTLLLQSGTIGFTKTSIAISWSLAYTSCMQHQLQAAVVVAEKNVVPYSLSTSHMLEHAPYMTKTNTSQLLASLQNVQNSKECC